MGTPKPPRLMQWRGQWYVFYHDYVEDRPRRVSCKSLRATTQRAREKLLKRFSRREKQDISNAFRFEDAAFKKPLVAALAEYVAHVTEQAKVRGRNPEARVGLSDAGAYNAKLSAQLFSDWLTFERLEAMTCEQLDAATLSRFMNWLASTPYRSGKATKLRTGGTLNRHRVKLGTCLRWLDQRRPRLFPDSGAFLPSLKPRPTQRRRQVAYTPDQLKAFFKAAGKPLGPKLVRRRKNGKLERFKQATGQIPETPVDRLFLLLALTGMRRGEALALTWADVDLISGEVFVGARKTPNWRILPLIGTPEVSVAPKFLKLLRKWAQGRGPADPVVGESFPKHAWNRARKKADVTPQGLRRNFDNYAVSLGVPPAVVAQWLGHSPQVALAHYRQQVRKRGRAKSLESAMGLF